MNVRVALFLAGASLLLAVSCSKSTPTSVSPSAVGALSADAASDGSTLKVERPTLVSPGNNAVLSESDPNTTDGAGVTLVASAPAPRFGVAATLGYDFELYDPANVKIKTDVVSAPRWFVQGLKYKTRYSWRVRATSSAVLNDKTAFGPWSDTWSFTTADEVAAVGYIRGNELYDPLINGKTVGTANGSVTYIPNKGIRLNDFTSNVAYQLGSPLTDGEFSVIVSNMDTVTPGEKTKIISMSRGFDDIITNARRFTLEKRDDGTVAWRFITSQTQIDTEGAERQKVIFGDSKEFFVRAAWKNNFLSITIREGGVTGRVIYDHGKPYNGSYNPDPHILFLGAPVGRSGPASASVPGLTIRQVWVSSRPRPSVANK